MYHVLFSLFLKLMINKVFDFVGSYRSHKISKEYMYVGLHILSMYDVFNKINYYNLIITTIISFR